MAKLIETATASAGILALIVACGSDGSNGASAPAGAAGVPVAPASGGDRSVGGSEGVGGSGGSGESTQTESAGGRGDLGAGGTETSGGSSGAPPDGVGGVDTTAGAGGAVPLGTGGASESCAQTGDGTTSLIFTNRCDEIVSFEGSNIEAGELEPGASDCRDLGSNAEEVPSIRYWGYTGSDPGGGRHTLAELTLNTDWNDFDWYNLSHVDAHNLPMALVPVDRSDCRTLSCPADLLADCPPEGRWPEDGPILSCVSPDRDDPDSPVAQYFEAGCADAYSWSGDDAESMAACSDGEDYEIVFCPPE
jgi:hypothetical protein